nr:1253_t:CDS:2 [Entrophospora candida]
MVILRNNPKDFLSVPLLELKDKRTDISSELAHQSSSNVRYENSNGTFSASTNSQNTVCLNFPLTDPSQMKTNEKVGEAITGTEAGAAAILSGVLAPITAGGSLALGATAIGAGAGAKFIDKKRKNPENVYFTLSAVSADGSE